MKTTDYKIVLIIILIPLLIFSEIRSNDSLSLAKTNTRYDNAITTAVQDSTKALRTNVDPSAEAGYTSVKLTPANKDVALKTFLQTASLNFGSTTKLNQDLLSTHIPVFGVMEYNGLSLNVYQQHKTSDGELVTERSWLPKKPFSYTDNQGNTINFTVSEDVEVYVKALDEWFYGNREAVVADIARIYEIAPPEEVPVGESLLARVPLELLERLQNALPKELYEELVQALDEIQSSDLLSTDLIDRILDEIEFELWDELEKAILDFDNEIIVEDEDDGSTEDGSTDDGSTEDGSTEDGSTEDGSTEDGSTEDGSTDDGSTDDGSTDDGSTDNEDPSNLPNTENPPTGEKEIIVDIDPNDKVENVNEKHNLLKAIGADLDSRLKESLKSDTYDNLIEALDKYKVDYDIPAPILDAIADEVTDELFLELLIILGDATEKAEAIVGVSNPLANLVSEKERNPLNIDVVKMTLSEDTSANTNEVRPTVSLLQNEQLFDDIRRKTIVSTMEEQFSFYINQHNRFKADLGVQYEFVMPTIDKEDWYNTVDDVGVFAFIQGYKIDRLDNTYNQHAFSGARINKKDAIYGAEVDGKKIYYRASCNFNIAATQSFTDRKEAASQGYFEKSCLNQ